MAGIRNPPSFVHPAVSSVQQTTGTCSSSFFCAWVVGYSSSTSHFLAFYDLSSHPSAWMMFYLRRFVCIAGGLLFSAQHFGVCVLSLIKRATHVFFSLFFPGEVVKSSNCCIDLRFLVHALVRL